MPYYQVVQKLYIGLNNRFPTIYLKGIGGGK